MFSLEHCLPWSHHGVEGVLIAGPPKSSRKHFRVIYTPLIPHFYLAKLGYAGVYLFFLFLIQNIDCGCSLEPHRWGGSNMYPQFLFWAKILKISKIFLLIIGKFFILIFKIFNFYCSKKVYCMGKFSCGRMGMWLQITWKYLHFSKTSLDEPLHVHLYSYFHEQHRVTRRHTWRQQTMLSPIWLDVINVDAVPLFVYTVCVNYLSARKYDRLDDFSTSDREKWI